MLIFDGKPSSGRTAQRKHLLNQSCRPKHLWIIACGVSLTFLRDLLVEHSSSTNWDWMSWGTCSEVIKEVVILARIRLKKSGLGNELANSSIRLEKVKIKDFLIRPCVNKRLSEMCLAECLARGGWISRLFMWLSYSDVCAAVHPETSVRGQSTRQRLSPVAKGRQELGKR